MISRCLQCYYEVFTDQQSTGQSFKELSIINNAPIFNSHAPRDNHPYSSARNPRSNLRSSPKKSATWPRWSIPQNPSISPWELVHSNQGRPKAPDLNARSVFSLNRFLNSDLLDCVHLVSIDTYHWGHIQHTAFTISWVFSLPNTFSRIGPKISGCPTLELPSTQNA